MLIASIVLLISSNVLAQTTGAIGRDPKISRPEKTTSPLDSPIIKGVARDKVATNSTWSFLPLEAAEAETFEREHPTYDGRGTIIVILDTGVDPGLPGLTSTSEGKQKIIDVQDFSGTGEVPYAEATRSGDVLNFQGKRVLTGLNSIKLPTTINKYFYAQLTERKFQNGLSDLNFNESDSDAYGILLFEDTPGHFLAYLDSDGDSSLTGEKQLANYHERFDIFSFHSPDTSEHGQGKRLNGAINIFPERSVISVYFDDGSHGSHVAGIASGHSIDGQDGFNGLAPGAEVVGIKFADNTEGGVTVSNSMRRGFLYAANLATTSHKPVVVNMSFGIGSELEGRSAMDKFLDSLLTAVPELTVCISAGNEGPGLSTIGLPGSADRVITSGAALPDDAARDLYGAALTHPVLFDFSSRGGELAKPDIVSPGTAVSTVPDYVSGDRYNGTSMSSPFTTGCAAVILSAMKQTFPDFIPNAFALKRAMMLSAIPITGCTPLDEGFGEVNIPRAFELLRSWYERKHTPTHYTILTMIPSAVAKGTAAFYRSGNYPKNGEHNYFRVTADEDPNATIREKAVGFKSFDLVSDASWLVPVQTSIYRRGEKAMQVDVRYDEKKLAAPGIYTGRIWAFPKGGKAQHTRAESEFELLNTIIVPYTFAPQNSYRVEIPEIKQTSGEVDRFFFAIPVGARSIRFTLSSADAHASADASIFDNDGNAFAGLSLKRGEIPRPATIEITGEQLHSGVLELDLRGGRAPEDMKRSAMTLEADVIPMDFELTSSSARSGETARAHITLTNGSASDIDLLSDAEILGYERTFDTVITTGDDCRIAVTPRPKEAHVEYLVSLSREDYNLFTDIALQILRPDSTAAFNSGFDIREKTAKVTFDQAAGERYTLYFRGGLAVPDEPHTFRLTIRERRVLNSSIGATIDPAHTVLYPDEAKTFKLESTRTMPELPDSYRFYGMIRIKHGPDGVMRLPLRF
jgi:tripeptidyl-peptidase-2